MQQYDDDLDGMEKTRYNEVIVTNSWNTSLYSCNSNTFVWMFFKYYCNVMECFKIPIYKNLLIMCLIYYHNRHRESTSRSRSRSPVRRSRSRSRSHERHRDRARRINLISKRVIISNVPYEMKWQDIKDIFRKEGIPK